MNMEHKRKPSCICLWFSLNVEFIWRIHIFFICACFFHRKKNHEKNWKYIERKIVKSVLVNNFYFFPTGQCGSK